MVDFPNDPPADQPMDDINEDENRYRVTPHAQGWVVEKRVGSTWNMAENRLWSTKELAQQRAQQLDWEFHEADTLDPPVFAPSYPSATRDPWVPFQQPVPRPIEPAPGTVLGFTKRYREDGPAYSFAAIHMHRCGWYLTGPKYAGHPMQWDTLLDFIGEPADWARVGVVTGWTPLVGLL